MPTPTPGETGDDQLFRELIVEFSADFVRLLAPDIASQLDLSDFEFELCEYFSDSPRGGRPRRPDLAASAPRLADPDRHVTLHAEVEHKYRRSRVPRFLDYNRLLASRTGRPTHVRGVRPWWSRGDRATPLPRGGKASKKSVSLA